MDKRISRSFANLQFHLNRRVEVESLVRNV